MSTESTSDRIPRLSGGNMRILSGEGARRVGGRFNPVGIAAVYASDSIALAVLRYSCIWIDPSCHPTMLSLPIGFDGRKVGRSFLSAELTNHIRQRRTSRTFTPHPSSAFYSVLVPRESNYVLLPDAPGFNARVEWSEPLRFDERLFAQLN